MAYGPDQILRLVELGEEDRLLSSHDIWLCAGCQTCGTRCPNDIDIAGVMDALRQIAVAAGARAPTRLIQVPPPVPGPCGGWAACTRRPALAYKLWTGHLMSDLDSGIPMVLKGKVPLLPHVVKGRAQVEGV